MKVRTHYDNLKIARDAPLEVIKAAYKALTQKYHPDKNKSENAAKVMQIINASYAVLSDEKKRMEHDAWIQSQEMKPEKPSSTSKSNERETSEKTGSDSIYGKYYKNGQAPRKEPNDFTTTDKLKSKKSSIILYSLIAFIALWTLGLTYSIYNDKSSPPSSYALTGNKPSPENQQHPNELETVPVSEASRNKPISFDDLFDDVDIEKSNNESIATENPSSNSSACALDPNGNIWPRESSYVTEFKKLNIGGLSTVTLDNTQGGSDAFIKLYSVENGYGKPSRVFFVKKGTTFTVNKVNKGKYEVRYQNLDNCDFFASPAFTLEATPIENGTQYSTYTLTLFTVPDGNTSMRKIPASQF